jgi:hypothetical protein
LGVSLDGGADASPSDGAGDVRADAPLVNPTITMLTPSSLPTNNPGSFTLLIDGRDFPPGLDICFEHNCWSATYLSPTQISAVIPGAALSGSPRVVEVQVSQIGAPYLESNILTFTITAPQ